MPVELRIGDWENAMNFAAKKNKDILESIDVYHQGIARDSVRIEPLHIPPSVHEF